MQKLCCFSDPPSISVNLKCTSSCCASKMNNAQRNVDSVDFDANTRKKKEPKIKEREKSKSCCCYSIKRVFRGNSHANAEGVTEANDE